MIAALVLLSLSAPLTAWVVLRHLSERDTRDRAERDLLIQRIQAPEVAVAQSVDRTVESPAAIPPWDDEAAMEYLNNRGE